jgi:ectoine hydroxylase-related dioxygenase (phytanoyl-CoA dioxygenase family)
MAVKAGTVRRIERSNLQGIVDAIVDNGCCIIKGFTHPDTVAKVNEETRPYIEADKPWIVSTRPYSSHSHFTYLTESPQGDLFPPETRRCSNMIGRSKTAREEWLVDPLIRKLNAEFIDRTTSNYYGETRHTYTSEAILSIALSFDIGPGAKAQRLHRDDKNYHARHSDQTKSGYQRGSDTGLAFMFAGVKTTQANGATLAVPGSHLWSSEVVPKLNDDIAYAELEVGDVWVMLGGLYHAGGANTTTDEHRVVHGLFFTPGYLRQEENVYLANSAEDVLTWSPEAQKVAGFSVSSPNIGFVNFVSPSQYLQNGGVVDHYGDLDASQEKRLDSPLQ